MADPRRLDEGYLQVMEAILVTLVMLGAAYAVVTLNTSSTETSRTRNAVADVSTDALTVLAGLRDDRGSVLDGILADSFHCLEDAAPPAGMCQGTAAANLTFQMALALPPGAGYAVLLDNGVATRELYRAPLPATEIASASLPLVPDWNLTFVLPELSCYQSGMDVNLTLLSIRHGAVANVSAAGVTTATGGPWNGTWGNNTTLAGSWNVSLPSATRPASGNVYANVTGKRGTFPGESSYQSCDLNNKGASILSALHATTLTMNASAPVGSTQTISAGLTGLSGVSGVTLVSANVTIYEPLPGRDGEPDAYAPAATLALPAGTSPSVTWDVPAWSLYGEHPVVLRASMLVGSTTFEARLVRATQIALPSGTVPIETPYRAVVQAWFADWR